MMLNLADGLAKSPAVAQVTALPEFGRARGHWPAPSSIAGGPMLARCVLRAEPASSKTARDFTRTTLSDWELGQMYEDTEMVVSELVTNALRHGLQGLRSSAVPPTLQLVLLRHERRLVAMVTDPADQAPTLSDRGDFCETGRGLRIVEALSGSWGWAPLVTGGKAVWAAFDLPRP